MRCNFIGSINSDMGILESIKEVLNYFSYNFSEIDSSRPVIEGVPFKTLIQSERDIVKALFLDIEIKEAVWGVLIKKFWDQMGILSCSIKYAGIFLKRNLFISSTTSMAGLFFWKRLFHHFFTLILTKSNIL